MHHSCPQFFTSSQSFFRKSNQAFNHQKPPFQMKFQLFYSLDFFLLIIPVQIKKILLLLKSLLRTREWRKKSNNEIKFSVATVPDDKSAEVRIKYRKWKNSIKTRRQKKKSHSSKSALHAGIYSFGARLSISYFSGTPAHTVVNNNKSSLDISSNFFFSSFRCR